MTATRLAPDTLTDPSGIGGADYATRIKAEIDPLWNGIITNVVTVGGSANAITGICSPPLVAYPVLGQTFRLIPTANNTGAPTVNLDGRGVISLRDEDGNGLVEDEIVASRPIMFYYETLDTDCFRLCNPTTASLLDVLAAQIAANTNWESLGDTTVGAAVAYVEHTFAADAYSLIVVMIAGLKSVNSVVTPAITLRNAAAQIVLVSDDNDGTGATSITPWTMRCEFGIDLVTATNQHYGKSFGNRFGTGFTEDTKVGQHATQADRVRVAFSAGNVGAGRIMTYGLKVPV